VLDDLHENSGVVTRKTLIPVEERPVEQLDTLSLRGRELLEMQTLGGFDQGPVIDVDADDAFELRVGEQTAKEPAITTAEVEDAARAGVFERPHHRRVPSLVKSRPGGLDFGLRGHFDFIDQESGYRLLA
jgi:hypothetical protein